MFEIRWTAREELLGLMAAAHSDEDDELHTYVVRSRRRMPVLLQVIPHGNVLTSFSISITGPEQRPLLPELRASKSELRVSIPKQSLSIPEQSPSRA
jgi:hypothetical protein